MKQAQVLPSPASPQRTAKSLGQAPVTPKLTDAVPTKAVVRRLASADPTRMARERLVAALLAADGRPSITRAADAVLAAGFAVPVVQEAQMQLLEHADGAVVRAAIANLDALWGTEAIRRRVLLEHRLERIEKFADDLATREAAAALRRKL